MKSRVSVECYSGYKADQRPIGFQLGGVRYEVEEIVDQWYGPDATYFRVRASDGNVYVLRHAAGDAGDEWTLEAFRRA